MKQNREPRNKPTQIQSTDFCCGNKGKSMEKDHLLTNGVENIEHPKTQTLQLP